MNRLSAGNWSQSSLGLYHRPAADIGSESKAQLGKRNFRLPGRKRELVHTWETHASAKLHRARQLRARLRLDTNCGPFVEEAMNNNRRDELIKEYGEVCSNFGR